MKLTEPDVICVHFDYVLKGKQDAACWPDGNPPAEYGYLKPVVLKSAYDDLRKYLELKNKETELLNEQITLLEKQNAQTKLALVSALELANEALNLAKLEPPYNS